MSKKNTLKRTPDQVWVTGDTHFNHGNILHFGKRPFDGLEEMTEHFVKQWNDRVDFDHLVYHLGDFALSGGKRDFGPLDWLLGRLNGQKVLVLGNHDREEVYKNPRWHRVERMHEVKVDFGEKHAQRVVMCHYPLRSWNQMHRGAWMLHGHCHGNLPDPGGKILDVGVDCHPDYAPFSLAELAKVMAKRTSTLSGDHHQ